ncbi:MAG: TetR/AcrR family transcriptional regulator [Planctomycetota bacterium]
MARPIRGELRDQLLATAARHFAIWGLSGASLDEIARELGVTKGAIYFHFRSKLELFLLALDRLEGLREASFGEIPPARDPVEALRLFLRSRLEFSLRYPELRRLHWILDTELASEVAVAVRDGIRADYRRLRTELRKLVQQAARTGRIDLTDPAEEAFRLAACLEGTLCQHAASPEDVALFSRSQSLVEAWLGPLMPRSQRRAVFRRPAAPAAPEADEDFRPAF